jgi:hypothetical protein
MLRLAGRLAEQDLLRDGVTEGDAANTLWLITGFDAFDQLYTARGLPLGEATALLVAAAERALLRGD